MNKTWWLLALCGIADALQAAINLLMLDPNGSLTLRTFGAPNEVWDMGVLAIAAGACAIAAGFWSFRRDHSWLVSLHGLAMGAFGLICVSPLVRRPLSFRPVSLLFVIMAASIGAFALSAAQKLRDVARDRWRMRLAGVASIAFALSFVAVGFNVVRLPSPNAYWIWMSCFFGCCAVYMLWLGLRLYGQDLTRSGHTEDTPLLRSPKHAH